MIVATETREIQATGVQGGWEFHLANNQKIFDMLAGQYTNLPLAVMREYLANVLDAYVGMDPARITPPELHLPTTLEPWVEFKDYGSGMSYETVRQVFTGVGATTKGKDNKSHGGFGIGAKVMFAFMRAFATADQWTVESRFNGEKMLFSATRNERGMPFMFHLGTVPTTEPNGVTIRGSVPVSQHGNMAREAATLLAYFPLPVVQTGAPVEPAKPEYHLRGKGWGIKMQKGTSKVIIGGIPYPLDLALLVSNKVLNEEAFHVSFDLDIPVGAVDLVPSREGLEYTERTMRSLKDAVKQMDADLMVATSADIDAAATEWEALRLAEKLGANPFLKRMLNQVRYRGKVLDLNQGVALDVAALKKLGLTVDTLKGEPGKANFWRDPLAQDVTELYTAPRKQAHLFLDDVQRGSASRLREAFLSIHAPRSRYENRRVGSWDNTPGLVLIPSDKSDKALAKLEKGLAKVLRGAPMPVKLSSIAMPERNHEPRTVTLKWLSHNDLSDYTGPAKGVYVRINGNSLMDYADRDEARSLFQQGRDAGLIAVADRLLCVPRSRSEAESEPEMQELTDFLKEATRKALQEKALQYANTQEADKVQVNRSLANLAKHLPKGHPAREALDSLKALRDNGRGQLNTLTNLAHRFQLAWPTVPPTVDASKIEAVLNRYPVLSVVSYYGDYGSKGSQERDFLLQYIALVDRDLARQELKQASRSRRKKGRK